MQIHEFIHIDNHPVTEDVTYRQLLELAEKQELVAVVENGILLGTIWLDELKEISEKEFDLHAILEKKFLFDNYHILETIREFLKVDRIVLPVTDAENYYLGFCRLNEIQYHLNHSIGILEGSSIAVLKTTFQNYSLVEVAKLVESHQLKILTHYISSHPDSDDIEVTLVFNSADINDLLNSFERFNYEVSYSSIATERDDFIRERYDSLMHYLDL